MWLPLGQLDTRLLFLTEVFSEQIILLVSSLKQLKYSKKIKYWKFRLGSIYVLNFSTKIRHSGFLPPPPPSTTCSKKQGFYNLGYGKIAKPLPPNEGVGFFCVQKNQQRLWSKLNRPKYFYFFELSLNEFGFWDLKSWKEPFSCSVSARHSCLLGCGVWRECSHSVLLQQWLQQWNTTVIRTDLSLLVRTWRHSLWENEAVAGRSPSGIIMKLFVGYIKTISPQGSCSPTYEKPMLHTCLKVTCISL